MPGTAALLGWPLQGGEPCSKTLLGYLDGEFGLLIAGQPDKRLKAGGSYQIRAGAVHDDAKTNGNKPLKVLGVYVVAKTKPMGSRAH